MRLVSFVNILGLGGAERAACRWAWGLKKRGHEVIVLALGGGLRRAEFQARGVETIVVPAAAESIAAELNRIQPDAIHAHAPGQPHTGDVLGGGLGLLSRKIPVVQTNIFGLLQNPPEDAWTDFRLFISWTSCVQAARRAFQRLDESFFQRASVAVYPLDPVEAPAAAEVQAFRNRLGIDEREVLFGRLSRPEPNKWTNLALDAFRIAARRNQNIKFLLREPPPHIAQQLRAVADANRFVVLPATADPAELRLTTAALDVVLHTSSIGESFGYGIAEPMNLAKPVISHSVPWGDQAQIELVRHGECGLIASTPASMASAILRLAASADMRSQMGAAARKHIRAVADPGTSIDRLGRIFEAVLAGGFNPHATADLEKAKQTATYLDDQQFGHSVREAFALRPFYYWVRLHQLRRAFRMRGIRNFIVRRKTAVQSSSSI